MSWLTNCVSFSWVLLIGVAEAEARWVELDLKAEITLSALRELKSKLRDTHEGVGTASKEVRSTTTSTSSNSIKRCFLTALW